MTNMRTKTLSKLQHLKDNTRNYRTSANKYSKSEMKQLTTFATKVASEKVTEKDIKERFKTFHSAINYYIDIQSALEKEEREYQENYKYQLNFLKSLTNSNNTRLRQLEKNITAGKYKDDYLTLFNEKRKVVENYIQNSRDFEKLVENTRQAFTSSINDVKSFSIDLIEDLYNQIKKQGTKTIKSVKQMIDYYTSTYNTSADKKQTKKIIDEKRGEGKQEKTWQEFSQENEDNYHFADSILDVMLKVRLRNGETITATFKSLAKKTIRTKTLWDLVDTYRAQTDSTVGVTNYASVVKFIMNALGIYGFSTAFLQDKFVGNIVDIDVE